MGSEEVGNCSHDYNGDEIISDNDQPLKKARYVWQLKGKYHLKDKWKNGNDTATCSESAVESKATKPETQGTEHLCENANSNCNGRCYIEDLLSQSDKLMSYDDSSEDECPSKNIEKSIFDEIPVTLVKPNPKNNDYYLQKWQARQLAKGYMDNTINRVLEASMIAPFDASEFIDNCENDYQVEDEGILMAIQSHGLQSSEDNWNALSTNRGSCETNSPCVKSLDIEEFALDNYQNVHNEIILKNKVTDGNTLKSTELRDHSNFMEAAVSVAIQKKGLSSQNCV